jgi:hypothetical protein
MTPTTSIKRILTHILALLALTLACLAATAPAQAQVRWQNNLKCTFATTNCEVTYSVPQGQRLTVQYISTYCGAPSGAADLVQVGATFNGSGSYWQAISLNPASSGVTVNSSLVNIYADQGTTFYLVIERLSGAWTGYTCDILISGHTDSNVTQ